MTMKEKRLNSAQSTASYRDLRDKLRTEKNLNKTAREGINRQINMLDTAFQRAQLQLIQKHNQDEEAANNERTQRRIEE